MAKRGFTQKSRDDGGHQQHQKPGRKRDHDGCQRKQRDHLLAHAGQDRQHPEAGGGLTAGALQLVVKDGVLERDQVEPGGVFHQPQA